MGDERELDVHAGKVGGEGARVAPNCHPAHASLNSAGQEAFGEPYPLYEATCFASFGRRACRRAADF